MSKQVAPAAERNRDPILHVLREVLPEGARVLEVASGTGQHAAHFTRHLPGLTWQPTDADGSAEASVEAWRREAAQDGFLPFRRLDVTARQWPPGPWDAVFCANMIHIAPFEATLGLLDGAAAVLVPEGLLILYGPFRLDGQHTADSNVRFDEWLKAQDPRWGVRDLTEVAALAAARGLVLARRVPMPANNFTVVFRKSGKLASPRAGC